MSEPELDPLGDPPGAWAGHGFNLVVGPGASGEREVDWPATAIHEAVAIAPGGALSAPTGRARVDDGPPGLQYVHQGTGATSGEAVFKEPGAWPQYPGRWGRPAEGSVALHATLPRGVSVRSYGRWQIGTRPPEIGSLRPMPHDPTTPRPHDPPAGGGTKDPWVMEMPGGVAAGAGTNPGALPRGRIAGQETTKAMVLAIRTRPGVKARQALRFGMESAASLSVQATMWIESGCDSSNSPVKLRYRQMVVVGIGGSGRADISEATLRRQSTQRREDACPSS